MYAWVVEFRDCVEDSWTPYSITGRREDARRWARGLRVNHLKARVRKWIPEGKTDER